MKINISSLMNLISEYERKISELELSIHNNRLSTSIQELNGIVNVISDTKKDFDKDLNNYVDAVNKLSKMKAVLYEKNNNFKLSDGRTIQEAIVSNTYLRKLEVTYQNLINCRSNKTRVTEVNNSYFECNNINYDPEDIEKKLEEVKKKIQSTDFEIFKLNSIEFDLDI